MPIIAKFCGITIQMYFRQSEHNPPHIHARYSDYVGLFNIRNGEMFEGNIPVKNQQMIQEFIERYRKRLLEMWENQDFEKLEFIS